MDFSMDCKCGASLRVTTADAGGEKRCRCGEILTIPSLSELRKRAGRDRYESNIVDRIRSLAAAGQLPGTSQCCGCGNPSAEIVHCEVSCERPYVKGRGFWATVALGLLSPFWILGSLSREYSEREVFGRELLVNTPLSLCSDCVRMAQRNQQRLSEWMRTVPVYTQLLDEYPKAEARLG